MKRDYRTAPAVSKACDFAGDAAQDGAFSPAIIENLRPRTRETYESQLRWILATFEQALMNEITPRDVRAWHGELVRSTLHSNSVSKVYRMLRNNPDVSDQGNPSSAIIENRHGVGASTGGW